MKARLAYLFFLACTFPLFALPIVKRPISFSQKRVELTKTYLQNHYGLPATNIRLQPRMVIIHWTALSDVEKSFRAMNPEVLPGKDRQDVAKGGDLNVSAHFLVAQDGTIYQLMPVTWVARHCIGLNHCAIGIENVGGEKGKDNLTQEQLQANVFLVRKLKEKFPEIEYVIGHHEYLRFEKHPLFLEQDSGYRTQKQDPGPRFMKKLRKQIKDLDLKSR